MDIEEMSIDAEQSTAPGWDAIERILETIYPDLEPVHYSAEESFKELDNAPLDGISCYPAVIDGRPLWHCVTFGFTELYNKVMSNESVSGFGFELTVRLPRKDDEEDPPGWALNFLQNLGRHVYSTGQYFDNGDHMDLSGPIVKDSQTDLQGIAFIRDDKMPIGRSANGAFLFLQVAGITADELDLLVRWSSDGFFDEMRKCDPLLLLDIDRNSYNDNPAFKKAVEEGADREGSETEVSYTYDINWETEKRGAPDVDVRVGAHAIRAFLQVFPGRLPFGRDLTAHGDDKTILFMPAAATSWDWDGEVMVIKLSPEDRACIINTVRSSEGVYPVGNSGLRFVVSKTEILDDNGNVISVIG